IVLLERLSSSMGYLSRGTKEANGKWQSKTKRRSRFSQLSFAGRRNVASWSANPPTKSCLEARKQDCPGYPLRLRDPGQYRQYVNMPIFISIGDRAGWATTLGLACRLPAAANYPAVR